MSKGITDILDGKFPSTKETLMACGKLFGKEFRKVWEIATLPFAAYIAYEIFNDYYKSMQS